MCYNCFAQHFVQECRSKKRCEEQGCTYDAKHHPLLHRPPRASREESPPPNPREDNTPPLTKANGDGQANYTESFSGIFLSTVAVKVRNPATGKELSCFAMLDDCADMDVAKEELAQLLDLTEGTSKCTIHTVTGASEQEIKTARLVVSSFEGDREKVLEEVLLLECAHFAKNRVPTRADVESWNRLQYLTPMEAVDVPEVMILISGRHPDLQKPKSVLQVSNKDGGIYALETYLGYSLHGGENHGKAKTVNHIKMQSSNDIHVQEMLCPEDLREVYDTRKAPSVEERLAQEKMKSGMRFRNGKFVVPIPFKSENVSMPSNLEDATRCMEGMRKKFRKDPRYFNEYSTAINKYMINGHAVRVTEDEIVQPEGKTHFLFHHGVEHPRKELRVVFNLSKKCRGIKKSLNDLVLDCPDLLEKMTGVLIRFREEKIAVSADIKAFFHAVGSTRRPVQLSPGFVV